jgi:flagellar hook-associated protein FlgK
MSDLVSIASSAVSAYQRALGTVSNNIANVGSTGYSKQEVNLVENAPRDYGSSFLGTGASVSGVRRLYDEFVEGSLRNAASELGTQGPLVDYANRVVNIMGSETVGLLSAFDQFFDAARQLSSDASSQILRSQFLSKAEGLASRFSELNSQLSLVEQETKGLIDSQLSKLNQLSEQLALVNIQLRKTRYLDRQPPALLDQRDQLLREMSEIAKIQVREALNGEVSVSVGASITRGQIVNAEGARKVGAVFSESAIDKVDLLVEPFSKVPEAVSGLSGGSLSGLMSFRRQILAPTFDGLDQLAKTLVTEVNRIHREGIDLQGQNGQDLFSFNPQFSLQALNGETNVGLNTALTNLQDFSPSTLSLAYQANAGQINNLSVSGSFKTGDQISVTLNGNTRVFTLIGPNVDSSGRPVFGEPVSADSVRQQLTQFLEGGNANSIDGAFGRQIRVQREAGTDLLVSSDVFGAFGFEIASTSTSGRIENTVYQGLWTATDMTSGKSISGVKSIEINGMRVSFSGVARDGETLLLKAANRPASGIRLAFDDPSKVAAASRFRVIENQFNPSGVAATLQENFIRYPADEAIWLPNVVSSTGLDVLDNNIVESEAIRLERVPATPIAVIPEGYKDVALYLGELQGQNLDLQVFTRDGRHLIGRHMADTLIAQEEAALGRALRDDERESLIQQAGMNFMATAQLAGVSFSAGSGYSSQYLNLEGENAYRDMELFYGVKAMVQEIQSLNEEHVVGGIQRLAASVTSGLVRPFTVSLSASVGREVIFSDTDLVLNGVSLGALVLERSGTGAQLVMEGADRTGRFVRQPLDISVTALQAGTDDYLITADHLQKWLHSQPEWGQGEVQTITFGPASQDGSLVLTLAPGYEVTVGNIEAFAEPSAIAQAVADALSQDAFIRNFSGRSVSVLSDGSVAIQFATTDTNLSRVLVDVGTTGVQVGIKTDPAIEGLLGRGEVQTYRFNSPADHGAFFIAETRIEVTAGQSSTEVAQRVMRSLSAQQRVITFTGTPTGNGQVSVAGVLVPVPGQASPREVAEAVKSALERDASFMSEDILLSIDGASLRFIYPKDELSPADIVVSVTAGMGYTTTTPERFVDKHPGRRVDLNDDGSVTIRYLAIEGNRDTLSITPVRSPRPEIQTIHFSGVATATSFEFGGKWVSIEPGDDAAKVAERSLDALRAQQQTMQFTGSAAGGQALEIIFGNLIVPLTLAGNSSQDYTSAQVTAAVRDALNDASGPFLESYPAAVALVDGNGSLRILFDPTIQDVPLGVVRPTTATAISAEVNLQDRFAQSFPGVSAQISASLDSLIVKYPADLGNVQTLSVPSSATAGISFTVSVEDYREAEPGVRLNADVEDFRGLTVSLENDPTETGKLLRLTQTPLGQGEEQTLYFGPATTTGEIEIAGLKINVIAGETGAQVAAKVKQALERTYGYSELGGSLRQYRLNADGSLSVRAAVSAGNVRDLSLTSAGVTGVSFRSETTAFIADGEKFRSEVRLGLGTTGNTLDLAKLGFRTGVYLSGTVKEDLLVFATGLDNGLGYSLGATYTQGSRDPVETLRAEPFDVVFTSNSQYQIIDRTTGTVVADRRYDPNLGIFYRGVNLSLNAAPAAGDRFAIDGNQDGIGNNANVLRMVQLQNARLVGGENGRTLADAYGQSVNEVGNVAFQASIAQKALEVVKDQAVQARDKVSGVSLDEEAADLIRFQQAYQASAKVMQTASTLFDAIIGIR